MTFWLQQGIRTRMTHMLKHLRKLTNRGDEA